MYDDNSKSPNDNLKNDENSKSPNDNANSAENKEVRNANTLDDLVVITLWYDKRNERYWPNFYRAPWNL